MLLTEKQEHYYFIKIQQDFRNALGLNGNRKINCDISELDFSIAYIRLLKSHFYDRIISTIDILI